MTCKGEDQEGPGPRPCCPGVFTPSAGWLLSSGVSLNVAPPGNAPPDRLTGLAHFITGLCSDAVTMSPRITPHLPPSLHVLPVRTHVERVCGHTHSRKECREKGWEDVLGEDVGRSVRRRGSLWGQGAAGQEAALTSQTAGQCSGGAGVDPARPAEHGVQWGRRTSSRCSWVW